MYKYLAILCISFMPAVGVAQENLNFKVFPVDGATTAVVWGNGTGAKLTDYSRIFSTINFYGATVIGAETPNAGNGLAMLEAAQWALDNGYEDVVFMGHSQGAGGALAAADMWIGLHPELEANTRVCLLMPPAILSEQLNVPCFVVSGELDRLCPPSKVESKVVKPYPGPILHATRKRMGHIGINNDADVRYYISVFAVGLEDRFLRIVSDRDWKIVSDRYGD